MGWDARRDGCAREEGGDRRSKRWSSFRNGGCPVKEVVLWRGGTSSSQDVGRQPETTEFSEFR